MKTLSKYMTLNKIDVKFNRGEFVCIIGDVGSGKSSLLSSVIGDLIYVSDKQIADFGGLEKLGSSDDFKKLKKTVLETEVTGEKPIQIKGELSYVEQVPWIQNKTIRENINANKVTNCTGREHACFQDGSGEEV